MSPGRFELPTARSLYGYFRINKTDTFISRVLDQAKLRARMNMNDNSDWLRPLNWIN